MTKLSSLSLRNKFLLMMGLLLVASIFTYLILAISLFNADKTAYIYDSNASFAETLASETTTIFSSSMQTVRLIAATGQQSFTSVESRQRQLEALFLADNNLAELKVYRAQDFAANGSDARPTIHLFDEPYLEPYNLDRRYYQQVASKRPITAEQLTRQGLLIQNGSLANGAPLVTVAMAFSIRGDERADTVAVFNLRLDKILKVFSRSELYSTYLIDDQGFILAHRNHDLVISGQRLSDNKVYNAIVGSPALAGAMEYQTQQGQGFILSFSKLSVGSLTVISEIERDKAFLATQSFIEKSVLFALLVFFVAIVASILFTKHLTAALKLLYEATLKIAQGNLSERVQVTSSDEVGFLSQSFNNMADQIVTLLEATAEKTRMEQELNTAQMVQSTFFPERDSQRGPLTVVGHYQPATQCGGDWWGQISTTDGKELVLIADAMGHGVPAALVTAMAYSSCTTLANMLRDSELSTSPGRILEQFNKVLYAAVRGKISMTFFVASFDLLRGELVYANAGHNFPVLVPESTEDDRIVSRPRALQKVSPKVPVTLQLEGVPLGLDPDAKFEEKSMPLRPGDKLFMYTDGLIECNSESGKAWGRKQMLKSILQHIDTDASGIKANVLKEAFEHFGQEPLLDDITVVIAELDRKWRPMTLTASA